MDEVTDIGGRIVQRTKFLRLVEFSCTSSTAANDPPILCLHGAPESHEIWFPFLDDLRERGKVLLLAFPSEISDAPTPGIVDCVLGRLWKEFEAMLDQLIMGTKKINVVAHDFGATWFWTWLWRNLEQRSKHINSVVAVSVGPSMRYDFIEHGPLMPISWLYSMFFCLGYYTWTSLIDWSLRSAGGYKAKKPVTSKSLYWYWYGLLWPLRLPFDYLGVTNLLSKYSLLDWGASKDYAALGTFPILFLTSKEMDRIAFTQDFLNYVEADKDDRGHELVFTEAEAAHFIISNQSPRAREAIRRFLSSHSKLS